MKIWIFLCLLRIIENYVYKKVCSWCCIILLVCCLLNFFIGIISVLCLSWFKVFINNFLVMLGFVMSMIWYSFVILFIRYLKYVFVILCNWLLCRYLCLNVCFVIIWLCFFVSLCLRKVIIIMVNVLIIWLFVLVLLLM